MKLCNHHCIPCCDYCRYVVHGNLEYDDTDGPLYCDKHDDDYHIEIVQGCGYCDDFYCVLAD